MFLALGLQRETASRGSIGLYAQVHPFPTILSYPLGLIFVQIIFAAILQRLFLNEPPVLLSIIGTCIIVFSAGYVAVRFVSELASAITHMFRQVTKKGVGADSDKPLSTEVETERAPLLGARVDERDAV